MTKSRDRFCVRDFGRLAALAVLLMGAARGERLPGEYMNEIWTGYETAHIKWAKPYSPGKIKAFFIVPYTAAREVAELAQRLDLDARGETTFTERALGGTDRYTARVFGTSPEEKKLSLLRKLEKPFDVLVLGNFPFNTLPIEVQYRIAEKVVQGTGLALVYRRPCRKEFFRHPDAPGVEAISSGIPFRGLSFYRERFLKEKKAGDSARVSPQVIKAFNARKGRVVLLDYGIQAAVRAGGFCLTPREFFNSQTQAQYEYHQMLVMNAIVWAAGREKPVAIRKPGICQGPAKAESLPRQEPLILESRVKETATVTVTVRNAWGEIEHEQMLPMDLVEGQNRAVLQLPQLFGGGHYLDVRVAGARGALGWSSFWFQILPRVRIERLSLDSFSFERTGPVAGTVQFSGPCGGKGFHLEARLLDNYGRWFGRSEVAVRPKATRGSFRVSLDNAISLAGRCRVRLLGPAAGGAAMLDEQEAEFVVPKRKLEVFPALLWGTYPGILGHWLNEQIRRAGFNTILLPHYMPGNPSERGERRRIAAVTRDDMLAVPYTAHIGQWPILSTDEAYKKKRARELDWARRLAPYGPLVYSLGDENRIFPEVGFHQEDLPGFHDFLKREYGAVEALNTAWGAQFKSFEEASPVHLTRARDKGFFAQYHDTEAYRESLYARWHHWYNDLYHSVDPHAKVGSEGSHPGDLELTLQGLNFWGPYRRPVSNALLSSLAPRSLIRGNWFGGYVSRRKDLGGLRRFLWETFLDGNNLFEIFCSYTAETIFNNDFTFGYWANAFLPDMKEIVDGLGQLSAASEPVHDSVAIYHSQASLHAAAAHPLFANWRQEHRAVLQWTEDSGYHPYYVTSRQVEKGALEGPAAPRVLVLPLIQALSDSEVTALTKFVQNGGMLIANAAPGLLDDHCRPRRLGPLDDLFGIRREKPFSQARGHLKRVVEKFTLCGKLLSLPELAAETETGNDAGEPEIPADVSVQPTSGLALGRCGAAPAIILSSHKKGAALLLNFGVAKYCSLPHEQRRRWQSLLSTFLGAVIQPFCFVKTEDGRPVLNARVSVSRRCAVTTVGLLAPRPTPSARLLKATLHLREPAHLYNQRTGAYYGRAAFVDLELQPTTGTMLSLLPYRVDRLKVTGDRRVAPGSGAEIKISVRTTPSGKARGHLFRVHLANPAGKDVWHYARTVSAPDGDSAALTLPFAFNDLPGTWTARVSDVASGVSQTFKIKVKEKKTR